jgi:hypothetical protein
MFWHRAQWRALFEKVMNLTGPLSGEDFLDFLSNFRLFWMDSAPKFWLLNKKK